MKNLYLLLVLLAGCALFVTSLFCTTGCVPPAEPCDPPTNVQVIGLSPTSATISWSAPPGTTVEISVSPQPVPAGPFTTTDSTFTITGLSPDSLYKVTLRTVCSDGVYSPPVQISLKTTVIIIVDVIVQKEAILSDANSICLSPLSDVTGSPTPLNWDVNVNEELLVISDGNQTARVLIYKRKNASGAFEYYSLANGRSLCAASALNTPATTQASANGALLIGSNYSVEVTPANATMTSSSGASYSMYR